MATLQLELVSPERLILSRGVEMVTIPAAEGEMSVLPGHAPMVVALRGGVLRVREDGQETVQMFVPGGFAEVAADRCTVLADEATPVAELSRAAAESRLAEAEAALAALGLEETADRREAALTRVVSLRAMRDVAGAA